MAQRIIGLDPGSHAVKAVVLEGGFKGFVVRHFFSVPVPQDPPESPRPYPERLAEALAALRETAGSALKADAVYTAIPGSQITTHLVTLPFSDARKIEQTLPFELEDQLPFDIDEVVFDWQVLGSRQGGTEVLVGVVRRETLSELLRVLGEAGLDPKVVGLSALSYQNLFAHGVAKAAPASAASVAQAAGAEGTEPQAAPVRAEALLDVGHEASGLMVVEDGVARFARTFPVAGLALTRAVAASEGVDLETAEVLKTTQGRLDAPGAATERLPAALSRGLAPLVRSVRQSFLAYQARSRGRVERLHLTGGAAHLPGLAEYLARELGVEVTPLDPFAASAPEAGAPPSHDPAGALAVALALRGQPGARTAKVNFRKGPFTFKGDLSYMRGQVWRLGVVAAVLLLALGASVFTRFRILAAEEARVDEALCQLTTKVFGECYTNPDDALSRLQTVRAQGTGVPAVSAADVLSEVSSRLKGLEEIQLTELDITGSKVRLQGEAGSFDGVAQVVKALQDYACFGEVSQGQTRQARTANRIEFNVDAVMSPECAS